VFGNSRIGGIGLRGKDLTIIANCESRAFTNVPIGNTALGGKA
jgi:hypothetical protein